MGHSQRTDTESNRDLKGCHGDIIFPLVDKLMTTPLLSIRQYAAASH